MVLDKHRNIVEPVLSPIANHLKTINPDVFTWVSLLFAVLAGVFFYLSDPSIERTTYYLFIASLFVFLNGLFDALDGKIAKLANKVSKRGDFLDHAIDRYADVFIIGGLAISAWTRPLIGLLALVGVLLTSYMGTQAQAIGHKRDYSGFLGRADRLFLLMIFPIIQYIFIQMNITFPWNTTLLEWVLIYFAVMGNITAIQRFFSTLKWFRKQ